MAQVCIYFQMHQPRRLRSYNVFDSSHDYFDDVGNRAILGRVAEKCYLPATRLILDLVKRHEGHFRVSYSITGTLLEQLEEGCPEVICLLRELAGTGCVEFLGETYHHSLAWLYSKEEFLEQVILHSEAIERLLGVKPRVFRNTELIYSNDLAKDLSGLGQFQGILTEGVDRVLDGRSPGGLYHVPGDAEVKVLLKNYYLSDDLAFRFSDTTWEHFPLDVKKYVGWINAINETGFSGPVERQPAGVVGGFDDRRLCNLFMDYETFGEHQWEDKGIFELLEGLPAGVLEGGKNCFVTVSEAIEGGGVSEAYDCPQIISWADEQRDTSAWVGNAMQASSLKALYQVEEKVKSAKDENALLQWRYLSTSDHFYYMCTKYFADGQVHDYFSPYDTPYDGYINFMNVLEDLKMRLGLVAE